MGFPIKTSDNNWLEKALELFEKRISISITDDANYNLNISSDVTKLFKKYTLSQTALMFLGAFYVLAIVCMVLLYYSFSLQYTKYLGVILLTIFLIICIGIPTYYLAKNRHPKIEKTEQGIDIKFSSHVF
ncbi:MAG: hypothetical protein ACYCVH_15525 [Ignavibacteriaceae bacterium]